MTFQRGYFAAGHHLQTILASYGGCFQGATHIIVVGDRNHIQVDMIGGLFEDLNNRISTVDAVNGMDVKIGSAHSFSHGSRDIQIIPNNLQNPLTISAFCGKIRL